MDLQALSTRDDLYLYDGSLRARGSLSAAQRAAFGLTALPHPRKSPCAPSPCFAEPTTKAPPPPASRHTTMEAPKAAQASPRGTKEHRRIGSGAMVKATSAAERVSHIRKIVTKPQLPARAFFLTVKIPSGEVRCIVWRGRAFVSSRQTEERHA